MLQLVLCSTGIRHRPRRRHHHTSAGCPYRKVVVLCLVCFLVSVLVSCGGRHYGDCSSNQGNPSNANEKDSAFQMLDSFPRRWCGRMLTSDHLCLLVSDKWLVMFRSVQYQEILHTSPSGFSDLQVVPCRIKGLLCCKIYDFACVLQLL